MHYIFYTSVLGLLLIICEFVKKLYTLVIQSQPYRRLFHTKTLTQTAIKEDYFERFICVFSIEHALHQLKTFYSNLLSSHGHRRNLRSNRSPQKPAVPPRRHHPKRLQQARHRHTRRSHQEPPRTSQTQRKR